MTVKASSIYRESTVSVVEVTENYELDNSNDVVIGNTPTPVVALTLKLPASPLVGQSHRLVAAGANLILDGNGNTLAAGAAAVALGTALVVTFTKPSATDPCGPGTWVEDCCQIAP